LCACPECGGVDVEVTGAEEAVLESVAYRRGPREGIATDDQAWTASSRDRIQGRSGT
jgi:hypothetical protein